MARSRLYRSQFLQVNTRLQALSEIYKIYIPLHLSDLNNSANVRHEILCFLRTFFTVSPAKSAICCNFVPICVETWLILDHQENVGKKTFVSSSSCSSFRPFATCSLSSSICRTGAAELVLAEPAGCKASVANCVPSSYAGPPKKRTWGCPTEVGL